MIRARALFTAAVCSACATSPEPPAPSAAPAPVAVAPKVASKPAGPPATRRDDAADILHGVRVEDPYRWLEDEKSPEVGSWMKSQDVHARTILSAYPQRAKL